MISETISKLASHESFLLPIQRTKFYPFLTNIAGLLIIDFIFLFNGKQLNKDIGGKQAWIPTSALLPTSCVTLGKSLNFSEF